MKIKKKLFIWIFIFIFLSTYSLNSYQKKKISFFHVKKINIEGILNVNMLDLEKEVQEFVKLYEMLPITTHNKNKM